MNMAALRRLPVIFVCINNQYGMGTRVDRPAAARATAFGLDGARVDGADVDAAGHLVAAAHNGQPALWRSTPAAFRAAPATPSQHLAPG
jgi:pyruvate dehydrogenase E1 component alpha subunit